MRRLAVLLWIMVAATPYAQAQPVAPEARWPERPIRFIVPFPAGATTDIVARIVAQKLGDLLGQSLIIENRSGASGNLGAEAIARSAPDGYTIGLATSTTHVIASALNKNLSYDPIKDFTPVSMLVDTPYALVVYAGLPVKNVTELIALARAKPRALTYSSVGPTSLAHMAGELFSRMAGVELTHVPYRSASHAVVDLNEGRIDAQFGALGASLPFVQEGKLRALAVTSARRSAALPDVPTLSETGLTGYDATLWVAIMMPAGVPAAITARLNRDIRATLRDPEVHEGLAAQAVQIFPSTPEELQDRVRRDTVKWRDLAMAAGIHAD